MAKNKEEKTNVMRTLEQKKIAYTAKTYPHGEGDAIDGVSVARAVGLEAEMVFKTLVCKGASGGYYVFDIPVAENLDLKKAARAVLPCCPRRSCCRLRAMYTAGAARWE